ncbi:hypothetical protein [Wolbachia endosymbiont (group A) of Anthophora plumipes]|uniref:hypothetical protein n=1 Tax=Wolbachia endosymbiont (group A) of Anthophora plumipes TaxID=3066194 RepID=UPI00333FA95F
MLTTDIVREPKSMMAIADNLYQTSLLGRQIEYTINSLKPPVIGGKHSFSFVSLLLRIGITPPYYLKQYLIIKKIMGQVNYS